MRYLPAVTPPDTLPDDVAALRALVLMAWAERDAERAKHGRLIEERDQLADQNDRLRHLLRQLQRMQFGRRSEKLDPDQFNLALEDLEQAVAASEADQDKADPALHQAREPPSNWWTPLLSSGGSGKVSNEPGTASFYG